MRIYLFWISIFFFTSCLSRTTPAEKISSPSGEYKLKIDLNKNRADKGKYDCLLLTLYDKNDKEITKLQTGASDNMKWAVGWYPGKDTIIVASKDIGTYAYHLMDASKLENITVIKDIDAAADSIFQKKYGAR